MSGWTEFLLAGFLFLASHAIPSLPQLKARFVALLGPRGWTIGFALLSTVLLFWMIFAAGRAPYVALWPQEIWARWLVNLAMPLAILLGSFGLGAPNPFAFEGHATGFDPDRPGIVGLTRQPLLWAILIWASAHLIANGDLAHVILFGAFALFTTLGMRALEARKRRQMGAADWQRLSAHTALIPGAAFLSGRWKPRARPSLIRLGMALLVWAALYHLHAPVIGVSPQP
ncbi:putative membrane protein [Thioclava sp. ES.031]|uniref:NnrU family protein n=1 Tax=Thioclava sp. ES.031 TaxID=1798203 RepID=UPI000BF4BDAE|nr:NnrU family protein [Thioclava sp. ES.031]PFG65031.1 putative membrane protein [Thioclava sp. ES.031]